MSQAKPSLVYWRLWTDASGVSRQERRVIADFDRKSIAPPAEPQWQGPSIAGSMNVLFTILPVGWIGEWHENPRPQWIIPLSGRWFVEAMDQSRVEFGPGEVSLGADQNCREIEGRRGHRSGAVGDAPAVLMLVQHLGDPGAPPGERV